jgi:hypothetical protein
MKALKKMMVLQQRQQAIEAKAMLAAAAADPEVRFVFIGFSLPPISIVQ